MSNTDANAIIVDVLSRRITDESVDLSEAAQAIIDAICLREEWTWRKPNGENGTIVLTEEEVDEVIQNTAPTSVILHRLVTDWGVVE
jgi:hypothetical protein